MKYKEEYKGIWVYAEQRENNILNVSYELLGEARRLADELQTQVGAVLVGDAVKNLASSLLAYGADTVYVIQDKSLEPYRTEPFTAAIQKVVEKYKPEIMLLGATVNGRDLGPRLAARLQTGLTADCTSLDIEKENRLLLQTRPAFGGNMMATILCPEKRPQMSTVRPGVMKKIVPDNTKKGEIICVEYDASEVSVGTEVVENVQEKAKQFNLFEAEIIISGGRGLGNAEGFQVIQKAADEVGGTIGASRAAVDAGWIDHGHQVGQTGTTVSPKMYIACGISGAIQHQVGISKSDCIIAINKDPRAAIFKVADYGIVGDLYEVLPLLAEEIKNKKEANAIKA